MRRKSILGISLSVVMTALAGINAGTFGLCQGADLKPVIYLYPEQDGTEIAVSLDYNGDITDLIPEFNSENTWTVTADRNGAITFEGQKYNYLFWEGVPKYEYDFFTGYCVKGSETEAFLKEKLSELGLNEAEKNEFLKFWLPDMTENAYNIISFQDKTYRKGAKLSITPEPDSVIRVFMAWYPSDTFVKINPQIIDTPERNGFTVVEWGGNRVK